MAVTKIKPIKSTLSKALDYIENPDKTDGKMLVSSFGCSYETADIEFEYTLSQALQKGNNLAFHLIQSFEPGEVDYQKAHEIGKQLADAVTKGQHEYVLTTHIDKGHVHNHIIFCAVNFVDHHKYNSNKRLKIETVKDADEKEWIGVFTSSEEMHKGSAGNVQMNQSIESILRLALNWEQVNGIVINPFGKYIQMTKKMIELLINGYEYNENERKSKDDENN